jgi:predicted enzyme related to lactoylglutathione lyase
MPLRAGMLLAATGRTTMSSFKGNFVWYELMTSDAAVSEAFYAKAVGWKPRKMDAPGMTYTVFEAGGDGVGGMMALSQQMLDEGGKPGWTGYIAVDDVDAAAKAVQGAGGTIYMGPADIPGVGRFAMAADPQGVGFALFKPNPPAGAAPVPAFSPATAGHIGWNELRTTALDAGFDFYAKQFGWVENGSMDMGPTYGMYRMFGVGSDSQMIGGMMKTPPESPVGAYWKFYFNVEGIDAAAERVKAGGGKVTDGPHEVPGGAWTLQCADPHGVLFGLTSPTK